MSKKHATLKKLAAGSVLVALSGFVPQPLVSQALADTATVTAKGTFGGGITMGPGTNLVFGSMIATGSTGKVTVSPAAATAVSNAFFNGVPVAGSVTFKAAAGSFPVNVTVAGFAAALALSDKGSGTAGSITLGRVTLTGPFAASVVLKSGTPSKVATLNKATTQTVPTDINVGAQISWSGARPIGGFSIPLAITVAY